MFKKYDAYKDSGVEWLGRVPHHWILTKVKRYLTVQSGEMLKPQDLSDDGIPIVGGNGYRGFTYKSNTLANTLVIGRVGAKCGCIHLIKEDFWASEHAFKVIPRKYFNQKFMAYFLENMNLNQYAITTAQPLLNTEIVTSQVLAIPLLEEQESIRCFLDKKTSEIDQAIAIKEQQIALLNERKQIVIQKAVTQGLNANVAMKDSGVEWIGQIPEHWEVVRAKFLFDEVDERSSEGQEELLSVSHMTGVTPRSEKNVSMFMAEDYSGSKLCKKNDLVMNIMWAWMGALGVSAHEGIVSPSYGVYRQKKPNIFNAQYLEYLLKTTKYIEHYNRVSTGLHSSRLRFYGHMFFNMKIGFLSFEEQNEIIEVINEQSIKIDLALNNLTAQIEKLKEYKTTLINDAVTGKIKVA